MPTTLARSSALCVAVLFATSVAPAKQATQTLLATPSTVAWGFYSARAKPALTIKSGDTVTIQTLSTCGPPERLKSLGIAPADIPAESPGTYTTLSAVTAGLHSFDLFFVDINNVASALDFSITTQGVTTTPAVPEPSTFMLFGTGLLGAAGAIRRRFVR